VGKQSIKHDFIKILCDIENRSWKKKEGSNHLRSNVIRKFFHDMLNEFFKKNWVNIWFLSIDESQIAYLISFYYNKKVYLYLQAYDESYKNSGAILFNHVINMSFEMGVAEIQLLRGKSKQKERWTSDFRENYQIIIYKNTPISLIGRSFYKIRWYISKNNKFRKLYFSYLRIKRRFYS
jgi:CelD/BcsL family acetyltransferase involved in cellulose biosynthesis